MGEIYTSGAWQALPGRGDEFVAAWTDLAEWTSANVSGAGAPRLLRDRADPNRFISFGPWDSVAAIEAWRGTAGFQDRVSRISALLEAFTVATLDLVAEPGQPEGT